MLLKEDDVVRAARKVWVWPWVLIAACTPSLRPVAVQGPTGDVALTLKVSKDVTVDSATFRISGNGITPISGAIPLQDPGATASTLVGGVPAGDAYLFDIDAASADGRTQCHGLTTAGVIAGATTGVTIIAQCRRTGDLGGAVITATLNNCPEVASVVASPLAVSVGGDVHIEATATDLDGDPLVLHWTAPSGHLTDDGAARTTFTCTAVGAVTLDVSASDGQCLDHTTLDITCLPFCAARPDGTPCDDGSACTRSDRCQGGACVGVDPVICVASDQCHPAGVCDPATAICSTPAAVDGTLCVLPNAGAACEAGVCDVQSCSAGFGNCDGAAATGCETSLLTSVDHCGRCDLACPSGAGCVAGLCLSPPPAGLSASAGGWSVSLSWQPAVAASGYQVLRAVSAAGPFTVVGRTAGMRFVDDAVAAGASYVYAVASESVGGVSAPSAVVTATPLTKQLCLTSSQGRAVNVFEATQSGRAAPVRTIAGAGTGFGFPKGIATSLVRSELFVSLQGGGVQVFSLLASGNVAPAWTLPAGGGVNYYALDVDEQAGQVFTAEYDTGGRISVLAGDTGASLRTLAGAQTSLGHVSSLTFDGTHGELFVGQLDPGGGFQQVLTFDAAAAGDVAPRRTLGTATSGAGAWAVAYDPVHDELFTTCNCNNKVAVFDRTATGGAAAKRTMQVAGLSMVYSLLLDTASDSLWVVGNSGFGTVMILELPRGGDGVVAPLHPGITYTMTGRLGRCN